MNADIFSKRQKDDKIFGHLHFFSFIWDSFSLNMFFLSFKSNTVYFFFKGTVPVIFSDALYMCKEFNPQFTMVPYEPSSENIIVVHRTFQFKNGGLILFTVSLKLEG